MNKLLLSYSIVAIFLSLMIESTNAINNQIAGIGMVSAILIFILYNTFHLKEDGA